MQFIIHGTERATGKRIDPLTVEAAHLGVAADMAVEQGIMVDRIETIQVEPPVTWIEATDATSTPGNVDSEWAPYPILSFYAGFCSVVGSLALALGGATFLVGFGITAAGQMQGGLAIAIYGVICAISGVSTLATGEAINLLMNLRASLQTIHEKVHKLSEKV